ncbi:MAG TPA: adenylate/guanylate cyclase domain-containing protein, partial [Stenomitos sp.]
AWPEMYLAGLLIAPLMGTMCTLASEEILRPAIRLLFPHGGLSLYRIARTRTLARRLTVVGMLWAYTLVVLAALTYRTLAVADSRADGMLRLVRLDAFFLVSSLGMLGTLALLSRRIVGERFETVLKALQQVHEGNLSVRVPIEIGDNLGILAERFNDMAGGLRERMHLQEAFGRYVSPEIARKAVTGPLSLGGETRDLTVLFADIRGFTALSEQLEAEALVAMMNRYFELLVSCVRNHGGHVNKFIGDGLMALFGAPEKSPRHAEDAVQAALAIVQALELFNCEQAVNGLPELSIGIGIATGHAIIGNVGSRDRLEYTAMGDTVNVASRIEGLNKQLNSTILVSEATYQRAKDAFDFAEQGNLYVRGKRDAVKVYSPQLIGDPQLTQLA